MARRQREQLPEDAAELLDNRALALFFDTHRGQLIEQWEAAETLEQRERLHAQVRALTDFKGALYAAAKRTKPE